MLNKSELDKQGNFKETFCLTNVLRWLTVPAALVAIAWMMVFSTNYSWHRTNQFTHAAYSDNL